MATDDQIASLRRATALEADDPAYTDTLLGGLFDDLGLAAAAAQVWQEKAASYAGLVDTTESGSTRRLSQLHEQAMKMRDALAEETDTTLPATASFVVQIERV